MKEVKVALKIGVNINQKLISRFGKTIFLINLSLSPRSSKKDLFSNSKSEEEPPMQQQQNGRQQPFSPRAVLMRIASYGIHQQKKN